MDEFINDLQKLKYSFSEINLNSDVYSLLGFSNGSFSNANGAALEAPPVDLQFPIVGNSNTASLFSSYEPNDAQTLPSTPADFGVEGGKENKTNMSESGEVSSSPAFAHKNNDMGAKKRKRKIDGEGEKPREVIHVRAKRGQATDSHSLAERVRRERINEKLRVLQDMVPGCYKTMGMAVMLDVIINYVRSLQNQIEFLSMKLSAASLFYDFNSPHAEAVETLQRTIPNEARGMETMMRDGYEGIPHLHSTWPF
ncbi:hypothetical protein Ancab_021079 [Ancistrocladus abbreviatus]